VLLVSALFFTFAGWFKAVRLADQTPFFIDEIVNIQAAVSLLTTGDYSSPYFAGSFSPRISSGFASTWPAAAPFVVHTGGLFAARLCQAAFWWLLIVALVMAYLAREGCSWWLGLPVATLSWVLILSLPYNEAFLQSLGELGGGVMLAWGLFLLPCWASQSGAAS
jgi:hypothetical protein